MWVCVRVCACVRMCGGRTRAHAYFSVCTWVLQPKELESRTNQKLPDSTRPDMNQYQDAAGEGKRTEEKKRKKKKDHDGTAMHYSWLCEEACVGDYHYTIIRNPRNVNASAHLWMHVCSAQGDSEGRGTSKMHRLREHDQHPPNQNVHRAGRYSWILRFALIVPLLRAHCC